MFSYFFSPENLAVYDTIRKNVVESDRPQMIILRMRFSRWVRKATNTFRIFLTLFANVNYSEM
jgi:hypothetical protein